MPRRLLLATVGLCLAFQLQQACQIPRVILPMRRGGTVVLASHMPRRQEACFDAALRLPTTPPSMGHLG